MAKLLLKVSAWINLVIGGLILGGTLLIFNIGFLLWILIGIGGFFGLTKLAIGGTFLYVAQKPDEEIGNKRGYVLASSIVSLLTMDIISFILGLIAYTYIPLGIGNQDNIKSVLSEEEKAQKRYKTLLALGCALVLLAGIIFAVTEWTSLSGFYKTIALITASLVFFIMSFVSEKMFKLKSSAITYYILGNVFSIVTFISAGYFNVFGNWFSLNGEGVKLYEAFLWGIVGALTYFGYIKYYNRKLFYILDLAILMIISSVLNFFTVGKDVLLLVEIIILAVFALISSKNEIVKIANTFSRVFLPIVSFSLPFLGADFGNEEKILFNLISFGIVFVSSYYLAVEKKKLFYEIFAPIFTLFTLFSFTANFGTDSKIILLQFILITMILYLIGFSKKENKGLFSTSAIVCDIALVYTLLDSLDLGFVYLAIISGIALLAISISVSFSDKFWVGHFEIWIEPIKVILLAYAIYNLAYKFQYIESKMFLAMLGIVFACICMFRKGIIKKLYFIGAIVASVGVLFAGGFMPVSQSLILISLVILFFVISKSSDNNFKMCRELVYGLVLLALALIFNNTFSHFNMEIIGIVLLSIIYTILFFVFDNDNILRYFTIVALLIPYVSILPISMFNDEVNSILYSLPWLALIFVYTRGFLESAELKIVNAIEIVVLSMWYLSLSTQISLETAIFIGIISFASILIGYRSDKWSSLYYTGIVFLILNTLVQLREFWESIPIWGYILVTGLVLIGIVTYKEYRKVNKKDEVEEVEVEIVDQPKIVTKENKLDGRAVAVGTILYLFIPIILQI